METFIYIILKEIIFSTKKSNPAETSSPRHSILRVAINSPVEDFIWCREKERQTERAPIRGIRVRKEKRKRTE